MELSRVESELEKERTKAQDAVKALEESMQREHTLRASVNTLEAERDAKLELASDSLSVAHSELASERMFGDQMNGCVRMGFIVTRLRTG